MEAETAQLTAPKDETRPSSSLVGPSDSVRHVGDCIKAWHERFGPSSVHVLGEIWLHRLMLSEKAGAGWGRVPMRYRSMVMMRWPPAKSNRGRSQSVIHQGKGPALSLHRHSTLKLLRNRVEEFIQSDYISQQIFCTCINVFSGSRKRDVGMP
jgi:hypothetical protein